MIETKLLLERTWTVFKNFNKMAGGWHYIFI